MYVYICMYTYIHIYVYTYILNTHTPFIMEKRLLYAAATL